MTFFNEDTVRFRYRVAGLEERWTETQSREAHIPSLPAGRHTFEGERQTQVRLMLSDSLKGVLAQRLLRRADGRGRVLAAEIMVGTPAVAALIREKKTFQLPSVLQAGKREGMQTMDDAVLGLLKAGMITAEEAGLHLSSRDLLPAGGGAAAAAAAGSGAAPPAPPPRPAGA